MDRLVSEGFDRVWIGWLGEVCSAQARFAVFRLEWNAKNQKQEVTYEKCQRLCVEK